MNKQCRAEVTAANMLNEGGDFAGAIAAFDGLVDECKTKDARESIQAGRAMAFNGNGQYEAAISASDAALEASGDKSLEAYFERAFAQERLGRTADAKADYDRIIELTEKNKNAADRATIYAKVADMNYRAGKPAEAQFYIANAIELDSDNVNFLLQRGDWASVDGDYARAREDYDRAAEMAPENVGVFLARTESNLREMEGKYGTAQAGELRSRMTKAEKLQVCNDLTRALELGHQDMKLDMFAALTCR
jgi:tetratricopeptide (TPR) repeat protein